MSEKRKDKKGRILRTGEGQRQDGRYYFRWITPDGNPKSSNNRRAVVAQVH